MTENVTYDRKTRATLLTAWHNMKKRCDGKSGHARDNVNYALRGITYDPKWSNFEQFYNDMVVTYQPGLTLDRRDNDKGYSSENCRWATRLEQINNRRVTRFFTINGKEQTIKQWCDELGQKPSTVRQRYYVYHWTIERSLGL